MNFLPETGNRILSYSSTSLGIDFKYAQCNIPDAGDRVGSLFLPNAPPVTVTNQVYFSTTCLTVVFIILGTVGNTLAFVVLGREKPFTSTSILLRALAVADGLVLFFELQAETVTNMNYYTGILVPYREFLELTHEYMNALLFSSKTASIYVTMVVAGERYVAVCKPLKAATICTKRNASKSGVVVFLLSLHYRIPLIFQSITTFVYDPCSEKFRPYWNYSPLYHEPIYNIVYVATLHMLINAFIPIIVLLLVSALIIMTLKAGPPTGELTEGTRNKSKESIMVTKRVLAVVVVFIILETPGAIVQPFHYSSAFDQVVVGLATKVCYLLGNINCFVNFILYFFYFQLRLFNFFRVPNLFFGVFINSFWWLRNFYFCRFGC